MNKSLFINVWITFSCNFSCRYCYVRPYYENLDMTKDVADKLIEFIQSNIKEDQELIINFHGGEPTLNFDIVRYIVDTLRERLKSKISAGITTNGSMLDDTMLNYLAKNFDYNLGISIDGMKATHNKNRIAKDGSDYYEKILDNAKKLLSRNENVRIRMTFDRENVDELYDNVRFFLEQGFRYVVPAADIFATDWTDEDFLKLRTQMERIKSLETKYNTVLELVSDRLVCLSPCTAGDEYYSIDPYGNIFPCTFLVGHKEWIIGNLCDGIDKKRYDEVVKITSNKVSECEACAASSYCTGARCVFTNYVTTGDYYKPNLVECNLMNNRIEVNS